MNSDCKLNQLKGDPVGIGTNRWKRDVRAGVEALGIEVLEMQTTNSKHIKMVCRYAGREWHQSISVSPKGTNALSMVLREARKRRDGIPHI